MISQISKTIYEEVRVDNRGIMAKCKSFTSSQIELLAKQFRYELPPKDFESDFDDFIMPNFSLAFYYHLFKMGKIPSPDDYMMDYCSLYQGQVESFTFRKLKAKLIRTYPSILRDFHFTQLCLEHKEFENVSYSLQRDIAMKVDIMLTYRNSKYGIALFTGTDKSMNTYKKKYEKDSFALDIICLPLDIKRATKAGQIYLYNSYDIERVKTEAREVDPYGF